MDLKTRKNNAKTFAEMFKNQGYEKGQTQHFWNRLLRDVVGLKDLNPQNFKLEYHVSSGGYIDVYLPDSRVIIEQKSLGVDLDKPEERQGVLVTPLEQALNYAKSFSLLEQPRFIIICNFETFRIYDRSKFNDAEIVNNYIEFSLSELPDKFYLLDFISNPENSKSAVQEEISQKAGAAIKVLFDKLQEKYLDPESESTLHSLNILCVRIVFCLFCEDTNRLFPKDSFLNYLRNTEPDNIRMSLQRLFKALNTPLEERDPYDDKIKPFPYVNGGLFAEEIEIPNFDQNLKHYLLLNLSQQIDWSKISPTIFGGIFESTLNPETRHEGGMHYTSPENIHKVIDPLFLSDLYKEYQDIKDLEGVEIKKKRNKFKKLLNKICKLKFLDPACGSGNFLTETYLCLRELEDDVVREINQGQAVIDFDASQQREDRITLSQFYGIEINDFAVSVANVSLWIAQLQANEKSESILSVDIDDFPLTDKANIVCANALRTDWEDVLPASECSYVIGNPPFVGAMLMSKEQKSEMKDIFDSAKGFGEMDYVCAWYKKAANYMLSTSIKSCFVSTNSICQGQSVTFFWKPLIEAGININFAYRSFIWDSEAAVKAHVHCVIIGFCYVDSENKYIFTDNEKISAENINPYLMESENIFIESKSDPICKVEPMYFGSMPRDGGYFIVSEEDIKKLKANNDDVALKYIRRYLGAADYINNKKRYCIWLVNADNDRYQSQFILDRVRGVKEFREASKAAATRKFAQTPELFCQIAQPDTDYIVVPRVSSERRFYVPIGFIKNDVIASDALQIIPNACIYDFGILISQFHNAWMRVVAGRLKSDYRYSKDIVYNNFIWPGVTKENIEAPAKSCVTDEIRRAIENKAHAVLTTRENYPNLTLAQLYDPKKMPFDLEDAHRQLDAAVEQAYGVNFNGDEEKIVAHLFKLYAELTA